MQTAPLLPAATDRKTRPCSGTKRQAAPQTAIRCSSWRSRWATARNLQTAIRVLTQPPWLVLQPRATPLSPAARLLTIWQRVIPNGGRNLQALMRTSTPSTAERQCITVQPKALATTTIPAVSVPIATPSPTPKKMRTARNGISSAQRVS